MQIIDFNKSILENIYFFSGPVLAILGFYIMKQIKIAKDNLEISKQILIETQKNLQITSIRDSIKLASEQIKFYIEEIEQQYNDSYKTLTEHNIERIIIKTKEFLFSDINNDNLIVKFQDDLKKNKNFLESDLLILNNTELFSTYFITKVADEDVAFQTIGNSFCKMIEELSFTYCILRRVDKNLNFNNTIKLYNLWNNRIEIINIGKEKEKLLKSKNKIELDLIQKINDLHKKIDTKLNPIGS